jgi:hypothetical protein
MLTIHTLGRKQSLPLLLKEFATFSAGTETDVKHICDGDEMAAWPGPRRPFDRATGETADRAAFWADI